MMWRTGLVVAFIAGATVLAYEVGSRLSDEAAQTLVGVLCGVVVSIPVSIGLLLALTRPRDADAEDEYLDAEPEPAPAPYTIYRPPSPQSQAQPTGQSPQIIVVAPPGQSAAPSYGNYLMPPQYNALPAPMQERTFKIVGEDEGE